jgi:hypothetical protein
MTNVLPLPPPFYSETDMRMRSKDEQCDRCGQHFTVHVNMDAQEVKFVLGFDSEKCLAHNKLTCIHRVRDRAMLNPWEDGKHRRGF